MPEIDQDVKNSDSSHYWVISCGIGVHIFLLLACIDLYFASPLDCGMTSIKSTDNPPAKRVVLFVADGLRAEAIYGLDKEHRTPFLTKVRDLSGSWGVSHTRVPTESRPGHVAMLGGIYEDPSAIFKGWAANPVKFDSVINQSNEAWSWGSPDIIRVFNKDNASHLHQFYYDAKREDFGGGNSKLLDSWVFNKVEDYLKSNVTPCVKDCENGNFFFLHLLGIDTAGHGFKPHSPEYIKNINFVDKNIGHISKIFQDTFNDNQTAFVFTSDHGMTDWGSHGDGTLHETESPIIAWGAGVKTNETRQDVNQIDIAPLLASLIGINIPIHSRGILPQNYLKVEEKDLAKMQLSNMLQLLQIFSVKRSKIEEGAIYFVPYKSLTVNETEKKVEKLNEFIREENYESFRHECADFTKIIIEGLEYYHNYYQKYLFISITLGFLAWMLFLFLSLLIVDHQGIWKNKIQFYSFIFFCIAILVICFIRNFPILYYGYFLFPVTMIYLNTNVIPISLKQVTTFKSSTSRKKVLKLVGYFIGIELLFFSFFYKYFCLLPLLSSCYYHRITKTQKYHWCVCWIILLAIFLMPVEKNKTSLGFLLISYIAGFGLWLPLIKYFLVNKKNTLKLSHEIFPLQLWLMISAFFLKLCLEIDIFVNDSITKILSWILFVLPVIFIMQSEKIIGIRLTAIVFGFISFYILVSSSGLEIIFLGCYVTMLYIWLTSESTPTENIENTNFEKYQAKDIDFEDSFRRAFLFIVFIFVGFFGSCNTTSLNSFDPMWVKAFLTVFSPFTMMALILLKIILPFILSCCVFRGINVIVKENVFKIFYIILLMSDVMVLQTFYFVTNKGSWLDIGSSLSRFIIMDAFVLIVLLLYFVSYLLTTLDYFYICIKCNK